MEVYSEGVSVPVSTSSDELLTVHMVFNNVCSFKGFSTEVVMIFFGLGFAFLLFPS